MSNTASPEDRDVRWLHISDLHFKSEPSYDRDVVLNALLSSLPGLVERAGAPHFLLVTGDIADTGQTAQYAHATNFLDQIIGILGLQRKSVFVVAGNHDVDRKKGRGLVRTLTSQPDDYFDPDEPLPHVLTRLGAFKLWYDQYFLGIRSFPDHTTVASPEIFMVGASKVAIVLANSATFCVADDDQGKLWLGRRCVSEPMRQLAALEDAYKFVLVHHPLGWLNSEEATQVKAALRQGADLIMSGHLHETDAEAVSGIAGDSIHLAAGACYQTRKWRNSAMFGSISGGSVTILPIRYEDSPKEVWTVDPSIYPAAPDFKGVLQLKGRRDTEQAPAVEPKVSAPAANVDRAKEAWRADLFVTPDGTSLYVEPRLMTRPQELNFETEDAAEAVSVDDIVRSADNFSIETRVQLGGTNLIGRLAFEFAKAGVLAVRKNARDLPNYQRKLSQEFAEVIGDRKDAVLLLDDIEFDRDERLLRELRAGQWFNRIIAVSVNRGLHPNKILEKSSIAINFRPLFMWGMGRDGIRRLASTLFGASQDLSITPIVTKVYEDLLSLCIPLTPSNVIMYLRILYKEGGEFHPLNRVDILSRYLDELLRRPSDAFSGSFSSKNRADVIAAFAYSLYKSEVSSFGDKVWHDFIEKYQAETLAEFDGNQLLTDLVSSKVLVRSQGLIFFRYSFFFDYYLGRYIAARSEDLGEFISDDNYLKTVGVIDVVTAISSDNSRIVTVLCERLEHNLQLFAQQYVSGDFDPLIDTLWPDNPEEEETVWAAIEEAVEAGPKTATELDELRTSLVSEYRTAHQEVVFTKFVDIENALFSLGTLLSDALRNSDDVSGQLKLRALDAISKAHFAAFQVGIIFASVLVTRNYFRWGSVAFLDFNKAAEELDPDSAEAKMEVVIALSRSVAQRAAAEIGSRKLSAVFRARAAAIEELTFLEVVNYCCILQSRGIGWQETAVKVVEKAGKNAFYLWFLLEETMRYLDDDVVQSKDREGLKRIVATIQAKRGAKKQVPGSKLVSRVLSRMEQAGGFLKK